LSVGKNVVVLLCFDLTFSYPSLPKAIEAVTSLQAGKFWKTKETEVVHLELGIRAMQPTIIMSKGAYAVSDVRSSTSPKIFELLSSCVGPH